MSSAEEVLALVEAGGAHVPGLMQRLEERLEELATSHGDVLAAHAGATIRAGGKRLRPLLVFLAAGDGAAENDGVLRAAVAVELIHSATLVHDDVLDAAPLRRGRPTVVATAGRDIATATGDLLFSRAFAELARNGRADEVRVLSDASSGLARGELLQREDAWNVEVSQERYLHRCDLKTARLFQAACTLGALEGGGEAEALGDFGRRIGLAFQILDDVLDVSGPAERTGKHRGTDLLDGTVTLPLILARERDPELATAGPAGGADARAGRGRLRRDRARRACWRRRGWRRWSASPPRRRICRRCRRGSAPRWSWWPTRSPTATPEPRGGSEVHRPDGVGGEGAREALDLLLHVGARQALEVADERLGAVVELLVEAVDRLLVVEARPCATRSWGSGAGPPSASARPPPTRRGRRGPCRSRGRRAGPASRGARARRGPGAWAGWFSK